MKRVLLIIGGGIAAYKCLDLIRRLKERGIAVRAVLTRAAQEFVTPLSVGALTNDRCFHGSLRSQRRAQDRAYPTLAQKPISSSWRRRPPIFSRAWRRDTPTISCDGGATRNGQARARGAPAMNPRMWAHPATRRNVKQLEADGIAFIGPEAGEMAERSEAGVGRMSEVPALVARIEAMLESGAKPRAESRGASEAAQRPPCARDQRPDARGDRSRALHRQSLVGQAGSRHCGCGSGAGRARDARHRARYPCPIPWVSRCTTW